MRYGFVLPGGTAAEQLEQAVLADEAGWDGVFVWEAAYGVDADLGTTGEETDRRTRAERLDEGIDIIAGLWEGRLRFAGRHYQVDLEARKDLDRTGRSVQRPRIPIWVVGAWPWPKSIRRVLRCDGLLPVAMDRSGFGEATPEDIRAMLAWIEEHGEVRPGFDVVMEGETPAGDPAAAADMAAPWAAAGCTWWLEARWETPHDPADRMGGVLERIEAGPPRPA